MIVLACASCQKKLSVQDELAGQKVRCPGCAQVLLVPARRAAPTARAPSPSLEKAPSRPAPPPTNPPAQSEWPTAAPASRTDTSNPADLGDCEHEPGLTDFLAPPQAPGELGRLGGFRILKVLGHGGMGVVFQGEDPRLRRQVAIKAMLPYLAGSRSAHERFLREARAAAALEHDHIVPILQVGEEGGAPFIVMPFLKGEPLDQRLQRHEAGLSTPGCLPTREVLRVGREIAVGLAAAHARGLVHRDIKPANVWLEAPGGRVKILDFGLARASAQESGLTQQGAIIGTPAYMAPEQGRGQKVDARGDLWSVGVVLYRMCTGRLPFQGADTVATLVAVATHEPPPPVKVNAAVPAGLSDLVMQLLRKDPASRPATAQTLVNALRQLERAQPTPAATTASYVPGVQGRAAPARRYRKVLLPALGAALAAAVVAAVIFWPGPDDTERTAETTRSSSPEPSGKPSPPEPLPVAPMQEDHRTGPVVSLLPLVNVEKDAIQGRWTVTGDSVTVTKDGGSYLQFPYRPPSEYDFRIEFTCRDGSGGISVVLARGERSFAYVMSAKGGNHFGLGKIAGRPANANPTSIVRNLTLYDRHVCTIRIRKDRVIALVDGKQTADWKTDYRDLSYPVRAFPRRNRSLLGLVSRNMETVLHRAEVVEISGRGIFTRPDDLAAQMAESQRGAAGKEQ
jgi:serine/threonine protein kinase